MVRPAKLDSTIDAISYMLMRETLMNLAARRRRTACSGGRKRSWIIYCWLVWCERKTLFLLAVAGLALTCCCAAGDAGGELMFDVVSHGARGDGSTDDTKVRARAIHLLGPSGGRRRRPAEDDRAHVRFSWVSLDQGVRGGVERGVRRQGAVRGDGRAGAEVVPRRPRQLPGALRLRKSHRAGTRPSSAHVVHVSCQSVSALP